MTASLTDPTATDLTDGASRPAPLAHGERVELLRGLLGEAACRQLGLCPLPAEFKLSVVIPVYNERRWIKELLRRVLAVDLPKEVLVVDDASSDGTGDLLRALDEPGVKVFFQEKNQGKGAAL